eukprot:Amastigsp_a829_324.p2 type:complete len:242 gc:universal Amastigsp_a829_324:280-1005(+)
MHDHRRPRRGCKGGIDHIAELGERARERHALVRPRRKVRLRHRARDPAFDVRDHKGPHRKVRLTIPVRVVHAERPRLDRLAKLGPVKMALLQPSLDEIRQHHDELRVLQPDKPPEVDDRVRQWALRRDVLRVRPQTNKVRVDVRHPFASLLRRADRNVRRLDGNDVQVPILELRRLCNLDKHTRLVALDEREMHVLVRVAVRWALELLHVLAVLFELTTKVTEPQLYGDCCKLVWRPQCVR